MYVRLLPDIVYRREEPIMKILYGAKERTSPVRL